jgi:hypothetical protein
VYISLRKDTIVDFLAGNFGVRRDITVERLFDWIGMDIFVLC